MHNKFKFAVIGSGFWSNYQIYAWKELDSVELVAVCDTDAEKAKQIADRHEIPKIYDNAADLFKKEELDFVDIISSSDAHASLVLMAAEAGVHVICQKPMAEDRDTCQEMVRACENANVRFYIHENFRHQTPIKTCKNMMDAGEIGTPFKARLTYCSGFPVFDNQPALAELDRFIIMDLGVHMLDVARFLFGEAERIYCQSQKVNPAIKGEDVANILLTMKSGVHCFVEISYASHLEVETFPQTLILLEGDKGSIRLDKDFRITLTRKDKDSKVIMAEPLHYSWADPDYAVVHSSIVECNKDILSGIMGDNEAQTTGKDNLKSIELVFLAYESDQRNRVLIPKT